MNLKSTLGAVVLALLAGFVVVLIVSPNPIPAYATFLTGALQRLPRVGRWLEVSANLTLVGLASVFTFRAGQFSLGASAQILAGGMCAGLAAVFVPLPVVPLVAVCLCAALLGGFLIGLLPGVLKAYLGANELLTTLMLNAIVPNLLGLLFFNLELNLPRLPALLPRLSVFTGYELGTLHVGSLLVPLFAGLGWGMLVRTPFGYALRITGNNPRFAHYGGIRTKRTVALSFAVGGAFAGVVGFNLALGSAPGLFVSTDGFLFNGIIVALLAQNQPGRVPLAALVLGYLQIGADALEQQAAVGQAVLLLMQAVLILALTVRAHPQNPFLKNR